MNIGILAFRQAPYISANTAIAYAVGEELNNDTALSLSAESRAIVRAPVIPTGKYQSDI